MTCNACLQSDDTCHMCQVRNDFKWDIQTATLETALRSQTLDQLKDMLRKLHLDQNATTKNITDKEEIIAKIGHRWKKVDSNLTGQIISNQSRIEARNSNECHGMESGRKASVTSISSSENISDIETKPIVISDLPILIEMVKNSEEIPNFQTSVSQTSVQVAQIPRELDSGGTQNDEPSQKTYVTMEEPENVLTTDGDHITSGKKTEAVDEHTTEVMASNILEASSTLDQKNDPHGSNLSITRSSYSDLSNSEDAESFQNILEIKKNKELTEMSQQVNNQSPVATVKGVVMTESGTVGDQESKDSQDYHDRIHNEDYPGNLQHLDDAKNPDEFNELNVHQEIDSNTSKATEPGTVESGECLNKKTNLFETHTVDDQATKNDQLFVSEKITSDLNQMCITWL